MNWKTLAAFVLGFGLIWASGCGNKPEPTKPEEKKDKEDDHPHGPGPHGGVVFDVGKWHGEFKVDHAKKTATVWVLGEDQKTPTPIKADKIRLVVSNVTPKIEIDLLPADADKDGKAFTFTGSNDGFAAEKEYKGTVIITVDKKPYPGDFEEKQEPKK
jgi:hypothetical protein